MDARRLRIAVSAGALVATAAVAVGIGADPLPQAPPPALAARPDPGPARLAALEGRAAARLARAERHLDALAGVSAPAPAISVAPPQSAPVTRSGSS